jgi:hypothetical protein
MGIETTRTGKIQPLDLCNKCLWKRTQNGID